LAERLFEFNMGPNFRCQNLCVDFVSIGKRIVTINSVNNTFRYSLPLVKESHRLKTDERITDRAVFKREFTGSTTSRSEMLEKCVAL